jgi:hypothetical protein
MLVHHGVYEALLDEDLQQAFSRHPELRSIFAKVDPEEEPVRYAAFVAKILKKALRLETDSRSRLRLCNQLIEFLSSQPSSLFLRSRRLVEAENRFYSKSPLPITLSLVCLGQRRL